MITALGIVNTEMTALGIPYSLMRWESTSVPSQYWIGEYSEVTVETEDGAEESTLILTGTTRGSWLELEESKDKIKHHFPSIGGLRKSTDEGAVVFFYENAFPIPTEDAEIKRMRINLRIKQWKGMN